MIADLTPILRGWGNYFRTGNSALKFVDMDRYVERRSGDLLRKRQDRTPIPASGSDGCDGGSGKWASPVDGTIRYPGAAS